ncbi:helix-turn-helix domain-containing protein [Actinokineospora sp. HUAS TT18]|uniref:helix-turn-helix domain-containing protein n=1 Tax=Actinokineospora sp. HUAS TT18 TaxID=3447451 RepID=UPI003F5262C8
MGARSRASTRELGELLRQHRLAAGLSMRDLGAKIGQTLTNMHRIETGYRGTTSETEAVQYVTACGASPDDVRGIIAACREVADYRGYWLDAHDELLGEPLRRVIFHESRADKSVCYEPELIPGLLQTKPYAEALFARVDMADDDRSALVETRLARQHILHREKPGKFTFFIHERALRMAVGDHQVMAEQLTTMMVLADLQNIRIRVVPIAARNRGVFGGPFRLFGFARYQTLTHLDAPFGGWFLEDPKYVGSYLSLNRRLTEVALDVEESRVLLAKLADEYDRTYE